MFDILTKKKAGEYLIELKRAALSDGLGVSADNKTDAVIKMRERIDEWIEGLKEVRDELDTI